MLSEAWRAVLFPCHRWYKSCRIPRLLWLILLVLGVVVYFTNWWRAIHYVTYATRPIWDRQLKEELAQWRFIDNLGIGDGGPKVSCPLHDGFTVRNPDQPPPRVYDVFIFSFEIDLLEVRMNELDKVVDVFIVIEAPCTFMGQPKRLVFAEIAQDDPRFLRFRNKTQHVVVEDFCWSADTVGWPNERKMRGQTIAAARAAQARDGDLFLFSDLDEIPRWQTIQLLTKCDFGSRIHLALDMFRYSFEFQMWPDFVYRSTVTVLGRIPDYQITARFGYLTDRVLGDAGWHCSWCLRYVSEFVAKMEAYTHADRVWSKHLLEPGAIQAKLCSGEDIFEYVPEATTFQSLISQWTPQKGRGVSRAPEWIVRNPERFRFLLPGGCEREPENSTRTR